MRSLAPGGCEAIENGGCLTKSLRGRMKKQKRRPAPSNKPVGYQKKRRIACIAGVAVFVTVLSIVVALTYWDGVQPVPANHLVKVYLQHGCVCAAPWMEELEANGFVVDKYDAGDMHLLRHKKHIPDHLQGCHLGEYLGYFLDGHIPAEGLHELARQRPDALGIGMASDVVVVNDSINTSPIDKDALIIFDRVGHGTLWPLPKLSAQTVTSKEQK